MKYQMSESSQATVTLLLEKIPFDLTQDGLQNFLQSRNIPNLDLRLISRKRDSVNHAYLTVANMSDADTVVRQLHGKPPLSLSVKVKERLQEIKKGDLSLSETLNFCLRFDGEVCYNYFSPPIFFVNARNNAEPRPCGMFFSILIFFLVPLALLYTNISLFFVKNIKGRVLKKKYSFDLFCWCQKTGFYLLTRHLQKE